MKIYQRRVRLRGAESDVATINDMSAERRKLVRFGVHAFGQFPSLPNARPDERSGSALVWSEPKFRTELCHHYPALPMLSLHPQVPPPIRFRTHLSYTCTTSLAQLPKVTLAFIFSSALTVAQWHTTVV